MKILVMPDSFKGTFSSEDVIACVKQGCQKLCPDVQVIGIPMADGGEGTVAALMAANLKAQLVEVVVSPILPETKPVQAFYATDGKSAYIEMAAAAGLTRIENNQRDPLRASTYGVGELLKAVLDRGIRQIFMGIGGSATNDGGMGFAEALGIQFHGKYPAEVEALRGCGAKLTYVESIDWRGLDPRLKETQITVMCDVKNPLTGPSGATYVYGPQKGAGREALAQLEAGMCHFEAILDRPALTQMPGAGAAGGLGAALAIFAGAALVPGADLIMAASGFDRLLDQVDLVVSGEGCVDHQTLQGKVVDRILERLRASGREVPLVLIAGTTGQGYEAVLQAGVKRIYSAASFQTTAQQTRRTYQELLNQAVEAFIQEEILKNS